MRELKFRVWSPSKNKFLKESSHYTDDYCFSLITQPLRVCKRSSGEFLYYCDDVIIQQFTGLKDKNNKDIHEGDILFRESAGYKYIVFWDTPEGSWKLKDQDGDTSIYLGDFSQKNLEIVGNIFEIKNEKTI